MFKYTKEQLIERKKAADLLNESTIELTDELLYQLESRFWSNKKYLDNLQEKTQKVVQNSADYLFESPCVGACGCLGPQYGELYCSCTMTNLQYRYRYDIALSVLDTIDL